MPESESGALPLGHAPIKILLFYFSTFIFKFLVFTPIFINFLYLYFTLFYFIFTLFLLFVHIFYKFLETHLLFSLQINSKINNQFK